MHAIEIVNLGKSFRRKQGAVIEAVRNLTLCIERGEIFGFLGPNGAGKSTTIKMIMGLVRPSAGDITVMGTSTESHLSRKQVGYLPENPAFYDYLTGAEYLSFVGSTCGLEDRQLREETEKQLKLLDLWNARNRQIRGYSKGMVQRLGLAQALLHDPEVFILDEPMSGLDPIGRALVKEIILDLKKKGKCVFFSTHITSDVESVCDRVGIIVKGELQRVEKVGTILTEGIIGYRIQVKGPGLDEREEFDVAKKELSTFLAYVESSEKEIVLIEPKRKNLEEFFLDIVKG